MVISNEDRRFGRALAMCHDKVCITRADHSGALTVRGAGYDVDKGGPRQGLAAGWHLEAGRGGRGVSGIDTGRGSQSSYEDPSLSFYRACC